MLTGRIDSEQPETISCLRFERLPISSGITLNKGFEDKSNDVNPGYFNQSFGDI